MLRLQTILAVCISVSLPSVTAQNVRLTGSTAPGEGRLEVAYNRTWGTVCFDLFDSLAAKVACFSLGYGRVVRFRTVRSPLPGDSSDIWLDDVECTGNESSLFECEHQPIGLHNCDHNKDVFLICAEITGITCSSNVPTVEIRTADITGEQSTLTSPNWPFDYPNSAFCQWRITAYFPNGAVKLFFYIISTQSWFDFVRIYDGFDSSASQIASLSGTLVSKTCSTTQRYMYMTLTSDGSSTKQGFWAVFSTFEYKGTTTPGVCSPNVQILTAGSGTLTSPNYPRFYPDLAACQWRIATISASDAVRLFFSFLSTDSCCDFVRLYDGFNSSALQLASLSGSWFSDGGYATTQRYMYITFTSDGYLSSSGFEAIYSTFELTQKITPGECSPNVQNLTSESGTFTSPNYPEYNKNFTKCQWRISASSASGAVKLYFYNLELRYCYDFVTIYDGFDSSAPRLAMLSGYQTYSASGYSTTQRYMYITSTSEYFDAYVRFKATYSTFDYTETTTPRVTCSSNILTTTAGNGMLTSPTYLNSYQNLSICMWRIVASTTNGTVKLYFNTLSTQYCGNYVMLYDGFDSSARRLALLSSLSIFTKVYTTTQRYMYITFTSDSCFASSGFNATYATETTALAGSTTGGLSSLSLLALITIALVSLIPCCLHHVETDPVHTAAVVLSLAISTQVHSGRCSNV